ncbi:MAG: methylated-DNA--[protein]-cysteine S-methyltransferase [Rhodospirillales bacterium]|nr:methylated-DNA--[protein]-cysteine S-methyltransferase [Rhodospirillales bacterium]
MDGRDGARDYRRIEAAILYIDEHLLDQPDLETMAAAAGLSPFHFQRLFSRWAGISPTRFLRFLTVGYAKDALENSQSVLDAALQAGLSGPGRLHDLFVSYEALSPGEYKNKGRGVTITYGVHSGPFGEFLLLLTDRGICGMEFIDGNLDDMLAASRARWPGAEFMFDPAATGTVADKLFPACANAPRPRLNLHLGGTNFQIKVWQAMLHIPPGVLASYGDVARIIGNPRAGRAIGNAMAANPLAFLIPCHRVIRANGLHHAYRWGRARRLAINGWEAARFAAD